MPIKSKIVTPPSELAGRDRGKQYLITEMPAVRAEKWAMRMMLLLRNSRTALPLNIESFGMVGVAIIGLNAWIQGEIDPVRLEPLMDEMLTCVQMVRDPKFPDIASQVIEGDIEVLAVLLWLRSEVVALHTNFPTNELLLRAYKSISEAMQKLMAS